MKKAIDTGRREQVNNASTTHEEVFMSYFTDPLCAWSWAFEAEWQKVKAVFGARLHVTYHMSGLIPDWKTFNDSVNSVTRPLQMGPVWMHIAEITKVKLNPALWMRDPPSSSYPACIAFKCAEFQSRQAAEIFLGLLREAAMLFGQNISKTEVLLNLAANPVLEFCDFDRARFKRDLFNGVGLEAFRNDLQLAQNHRILRFPALVVRRKNKPSLLISGYKKMEEIMVILD